MTNEAAVIQLKTSVNENGTVSIFDEEYSMTEIPNGSSKLVAVCKKEIVHDLDLDSVVKNLERSGDLIYLAYNGVAGTRKGQLQSKISGIQKSLADLCNDCVLSMQKFQKDSGEVLGYLVKTFTYLTKGKEEVAVKQLERCQKAASDMADSSEKLAARFEGIGKETQGVLEETVQEQGEQYEKKKEIEKQIRDMEAQKKDAINKQKDLQTSVEEMQELYNDAKKREETESNRAFVVGLVSAITSAIGAGVGAYTSVKSPAASAVTEAQKRRSEEDLRRADQDAQKSADEARDAQEKYEASKAKYNNAEKEVKRLESESASKEKESEAAEKEVENLKAEAGASKEERDEAQRKWDDAKSSSKEAKLKAEQARNEADNFKAKADIERENAEKKAGIAQGMAAAAKDIAASAAKMQEMHTEAAKTIREEKMKYLDQKLALEKENRAALAAISDFANRIKNMNVDEEITESTISSLHLAIKALNQIVTSLLNASLFWRSMEQYCRDLSKSKLKEEIEDIKDFDLDERLEIYYEQSFKITVVSYMARWKALEQVCGEYLTSTYKARGKILDNINSSPSIEESRKLAPVLAEKLVSQTSNELADLEQRSRSLELEKKLLNVAA